MANLSFSTKLRLLDKVIERYPDIKERYPEFEGEVPLTWFLSQEEIIKLVKEVKAERGEE